MSNEDQHNKFVEYYEKESASEETKLRFQRVYDLIRRIRTDRNLATDALQVADIGCGAGTQSIIWAEAGHQVRSLDINDKLVALGQKRAEEKNLSIDFNVGTALDLPFEDASFDVCLVPELLEHVAEWEACLDEACRVTKPNGMIYLSTSSYLCPVQQEFDLPMYGWYPAPLKRRYERLSVTTRPELVSHAKYPAVNWFSVYGLTKEFKKRGVNTVLDRFDCINVDSMGAAAKLIVGTARAIPPVRFLGHVMTPSTTVLAVKS